ncbi:unnamed protein product [Linum tenue]|uniref:Uncharacterized protein n=1 Tax=Linum tenue TaxID=586396 RepID=A0AAV0I0Y4_9ROSI|nr:unnamed protein product [Linum tenue]
MNLPHRFTSPAAPPLLHNATCCLIEKKRTTLPINRLPALPLTTSEKTGTPLASFNPSSGDRDKDRGLACRHSELPSSSVLLSCTPAAVGEGSKVVLNFPIDDVSRCLREIGCSIFKEHPSPAEALSRQSKAAMVEKGRQNHKEEEEEEVVEFEDLGAAFLEQLLCESSCNVATG